MPTTEDTSKSNKRRINNSIIRRDLVLPTFDRTLVVEKTHFENNEEADNNIEIVVDEPNLTPSASTQSLTTDKKKVSKNETRRKPIKKQSKTTMHGTASPAEVFHRNLVDAVSNVEDSDENEHYVYPYSGNESSTTTGLHRPISVRSITSSLLHEKKKSSQGIGDWLRKALYNKSSQTLVEEDEEDMYYEHRPRLRNHLRDHSNSRSSLMNLWRDTIKKPSSRKSPRGNHIAGGGGGGGGGGGYTSDDEDTPLLSRRQKRMSSKTKKSCNNRMQYILILGTFMLIALFSSIVYKAQPITNLYVDMDRVLATDKELIFDLKVQADNWNWWTIHVADADISIFAFSQIVPTNMIHPVNIRGADPAEYLGSLTHFDEPLSLNPYLFTKHASESITQIRIKSPGADTSGNERWSRMIRYPYGLVIRGVLRYKLVPFMFGSYPQSIAVCNVTQVDPTTGTVNGDLDKTICNGQDEVNIFSHAV